MKKYAVLIIVIIFAAVYLTGFTGFFITPDGTMGTPALVARVIDGDTIEIATGERVRLLGIDTPERGQHLFQEATNRLAELIDGKKVILEPDVEDMDKYDRLLRHIWIGDTLASLELVKSGYARTYMLEPGDKYHEELTQAESHARESELGLWRLSDLEDGFCIWLYDIHYNAEGNDNKNLNDEYITFRNSCDYPVDLSGWILLDDAGAAFRFSDFTLQSKSLVTVHTGTGTDTQADLYWGRTSRAVWNNHKDTIILRNMEGQLVIEHMYENY